jgi:hypothetical protein
MYIISVERMKAAIGQVLIENAVKVHNNNNNAFV